VIEPEVVSYGDGLRGLLYGREGNAVVWNHGSEREPEPRPELAELYLAAGYALFLPHRRGHGLSAGEYPIDELRGQPRLGEALVELHERYLADTLQAVGWLEDQMGRVAISGVSHGAIQSILAATRPCVAFAPAAMAWSSVPELHSWLLAAVERASGPIFLLQARNDYDLGPAHVLGAALERKGPPNRVRVYPGYGDTAQAGHAGFACLGTGVWGPDVLRFLAAAETVERSQHTLQRPPSS
jgi:pimeloyl-ACP methyl ester carboxylesterase